MTTNRRPHALPGLPLALLLPIVAGAAPAETSCDVAVYGGTSAGVVAAVQAARMGKAVVLVEPGRHLGGLTSGGLGATDIGNKAAIGGLARDFYRRVGRHYARDAAWRFQARDAYREGRKGAREDEMWTFEPHVAEAIFAAMVRAAKVTVLLGERLDLAAGVRKQGPAIAAIALEGGRILHAKMFIDASYEGDLMAKAGVSYHVGREANARYGETINGVQVRDKHQFKVPVDPYVVPGNPASGLLPGVRAGGPGNTGEGDRHVQAYNFRMCLTDAPENRVAVPKPDGYDPLRYELLLRYIQGGVWDALGSSTPMPNRKTDTNNNGAFSTDNIGKSDDYPDGDYAARDRIVRDHVIYQQGMMWFLANDPRVPAAIRAEVGRWGLCQDEFAGNGGWPHQIYVREARRMVAAYVMTQHHCQRRAVAEDAVGLAAYTMDSHNCQRFVADGHARNEGDVQVGGFPPYPIAYRAIVPKESECTNLLVPVCLSATHIAYGSIRMEPVFMVLGQSSATAACQAIDRAVAVQRIDVAALQARLRDDGQVLEWSGPSAARGGVDPKGLPGLVVDDEQAELSGDWTPSAAIAGHVGLGYRHDGNQAKGKAKARFPLTFATAGRYEVRLAYAANPNRAADVPVTVESAEGSRTVRVDQRRPPGNGAFHTLGTFRFEAGQGGAVVVSNEGTAGYVIVDAVQCLPAARSR